MSMIPPFFFVFFHYEKMMGESFSDKLLSP